MTGSLRPALLEARVPRYTSYPTAPHFHAGIDGETYGRWLADLPPGMPLSLYVHIPFCDTLCWFCGCHTSVVNTYAPLAQYLDDLSREIAMVAEWIGPHPVTHLHFGGGSPTMLRREDIGTLGALLRSRFAVAADAELAIEIDPRGLTDDTVAALAEIGITRASIGVQDCDDEVQRAINRIQPFDCTKSAVNRLRAAGIEALNIDLIYGLPHQSEARLARTIADVLTLQPDRLAVFGYAHVPHFKKHMNLIPTGALPGPEARARQFELAQTMLTDAGYIAIGLDHFARPGDALAVAQREGRLARNFQGYTDDTAPALIGLGASSIGALPQGYVQNIADVKSWRAALRAGRLPVARGVALTDADRLHRAVIEALMCNLHVDLEAMAARFGQRGAVFADILPALDALAADDLVRRDGLRIAIPAQARAGVRLVCAAFDTYLAKGTGVHAVAV